VRLFRSVAPFAAIILLVFGIALLAEEPVSWPIQMALGGGTGGVICRWLLPPAILGPPALAWLLSREGVLDVFPTQFDWALSSVIGTLASLWLIMSLAHRITLIEAERSAATELSLHDWLTDLANRRAFDAFLLENFRLSRRHNHALSLLLIDIDRFKSYNDTFGHPAGDEMLKNVGHLLSSIARETDLLARIGGDEFAMVLPETDLAGAQVVAERARAEIEHASGFRRRVTVSVGVATRSHDMAEPPALVQECDVALYKAKSAGRNHVYALKTSSVPAAVEGWDAQSTRPS
jgi:diguanylate cyclase (GGDEF)-like protein